MGDADMRKRFDGLALIVQETLKRNTHSEHLFVFCGRRGGNEGWAIVAPLIESSKLCGVDP